MQLLISNTDTNSACSQFASLCKRLGVYRNLEDVVADPFPCVMRSR